MLFSTIPVPCPSHPMPNRHDFSIFHQINRLAASNWQTHYIPHILRCTERCPLISCVWRFPCHFHSLSACIHANAESERRTWSSQWRVRATAHFLFLLFSTFHGLSLPRCICLVISCQVDDGKQAKSSGLQEIWLHYIETENCYLCMTSLSGSDGSGAAFAGKMTALHLPSPGQQMGDGGSTTHTLPDII